MVENDNSIIEYPDYKNYKNFLNNQYKNTKRHFSPFWFFSPTSKYIKNQYSMNPPFTGKIVDLPKFEFASELFNEYRRFEDFTSKDEVNNISLWALACIKHLSSNDSQHGKELEVPIPNNPRDARLDVVARDESQILILESKVKLFDALVEGRFKIQIPAYYNECKKITEESNLKSNKNSRINIFLLIGGEETDLYPSNSPYCTTGQVGNISNIFYDTLKTYKIKFISANALWSLSAYSILNGRNIKWSEILPYIFAEKSTVGLLSSGKVIIEDESVSIKPFKL